MILISLLITHVNERLANLKPGINCTFPRYRQLLLERIDLTYELSRTKMESRGRTFVENKDIVYLVGNHVFILGNRNCSEFRA